MLYAGFRPVLEALKPAMAASSFDADSAHLARALELAKEGDAMCGEDADLANLVAARQIARECAEEIRAIGAPMKSTVSRSRRALSALFVELEGRIGSARG
jgi:hypothetical protein